MRWKEVLPALAVGLALLGLGLLPAAETPAAKPDGKAIAKLIDQLGSDSFEERQAAAKALDAIGAAALPALEKAMKSSDVEIRKQATKLAAGISLRTRARDILAPTEVHLVFKDTPIKEAVAIFEKKAGIGFNLIDPENKLKGKKVTLDTGKVPFWTALEKFCVAAGLDEADPSRVPMVPFPPGGIPGGVVPPDAPVPPPMPLPAPPGAIGGGIGAVGPGGKKLTDEEIKKLKEKLEAVRREAAKASEAAARDAEKAKEDAIRKLKDAEKERLEKLKKLGAAGGAAARPAVAVAFAVAAEAKADVKAVPPAPPVALPPAIAVPPMGGFGGGPGIAFPGGPGGPGGPMMPGFHPFVHGKINLIAAKPAKTPADTRTSVRVRVAPTVTEKPFGAVDDKALFLMLQAAPEPRLRWQQLTGIVIDSAVDEHGQKLSRHEPAMPRGPMDGGFGGGAIGGPGGVVVFPGGKMIMPGMPFPGMGMHSWSPDGINHNVPLMLKKGEKASKKLKELTGSLSASFLLEPKPYLVADNLMKAAGKTFKGDKGGSIAIKTVTKEKDGSIQVVFEFEQPADILPESQMGTGMGMETPVTDVPMPVPPPVRILPGRRVPRVKPALPKVEEKPDGKADPDAPVEKKAEEKKEAKKAEAKKADDKPVARPAIKIEVVVGGGAAGAAGGGVAVPGIAIGGPAIGMPAPDMPMGWTYMGLTLQDDKGKVIGTQIQPNWKRMAGGGIAFPGGPMGGGKMEYIAVYRPRKGQPAEPSKLVFTGRASAEISIPFKLENIDLK